ncbi:TVP38/TMEM64 family protein [Prochlorococcus sp. MIT 1307]|uniref:TVP38/TMEM64 family protein n=1 Tax=Prochlorococcus sp. MIT 1307 TaxID=3096219 RepID=UPI002A74B933|nr:VTT domain-containing protein [Prochlorococcus sp. MIT 1307]
MQLFSSKSILNKFRVNILKLILVVIILIGLLCVINLIGVEDIKGNIESLGLLAPLAIFILRFTSVIIPALPSTAYSLLAGGIFGFKQGIVIICLSDLFSCSISFFISRYYGREIAKKLIGNRFMDKVEKISRKHLENNFFLMTGFLMTGLFDFVSYAIGLTKTPWRKFAPALIISILLSNPPVVALGAGLLQGSKVILVIALFCIFLLALISSKLRRTNAL